MVRTTQTATVDTLTNAGLSEKQAQVHALRMQGLSDEEVARSLNMEEGTVKSHANRARQKLADGLTLLPSVSKIETTARVGEDRDPAVVIWFENDAQLRYRWNGEEIVEETFAADDPHTVMESFGVDGERDELAEYALESLAEYINSYADDHESLRKDWPHVFEALLCIEA